MSDFRFDGIIPFIFQNGIDFIEGFDIIVIISKKK
jgi:hypothetical protein